jgi:hypothetical protein
MYISNKKCEPEVRPYSLRHLRELLCRPYIVQRDLQIAPWLPHSSMLLSKCGTLQLLIEKLPQPPLPFPLSPRRSSLCSRRNLRSGKAGAEPKRNPIAPINNPQIASFVHNLLDLKLMRRIGSMMSRSVTITSISIRIPRAAQESVTFTPRSALTFFSSSTVLGLAASSTLGELSRVLFPTSTTHYVAFIRSQRCASSSSQSPKEPMVCVDGESRCG